MSFLIGLVPTLLVLGILILIHELGHFIACRLTGVQVEKFSIGFGPEIFHWQGKETRYSLSALPFGGYVKPLGESVSEIEGGQPRPGDYLAAPVLQRVFIVTAGVAMNYLLSFVLFAVIFLAGRPVPLAEIGGFVKGFPAETSGLSKGDRILALNGVPVESWQDLTDRLAQNQIAEVALEVRRGDRAETIRVPVRREEVRDPFGKSHWVSRLGVTPNPGVYRVERLGFFPALTEAFHTEVQLTFLTYKAIFYLITGQLSLKTVSGPLGIMSMAGAATQMGIVPLLHLTAVLGISLAVINLLPVPALDGGHLLFLMIEAIRRRRVSLEFQERVTQMGFALLMVLMVFVLYNDLVNLQIFDRLKAVLNR